MTNNSEIYQFTDGKLGRYSVCAKFAHTGESRITNATNMQKMHIALCLPEATDDQ
ncbi:hypothetical protein ACQ661_03085 [Pseudidiomarina sp. WS423]|uniref:hypothetical protein n=1 Tax=Pseudidiomarina sp. WS423 TaxID=3425124 RepID=UPI003D6E7B60